MVGSGTYEIVVVTENGGGINDELQFWLAQTNVADMTDLKIVEAKAEDDPTPAEEIDKTSRAYIAAANDAVPVTPTFLRGTREFAVAPGISFSAVWDSGESSWCEIRPVGPAIGQSVVLVSVPKMKTGLHTFTVTATTPGGKTWNATLSDKVFVYNAALEAVINGGAPTTTNPMQFTRADNVLFRVQQQDLKGKDLTITKADWEYRNPVTGVAIQSTGEPDFPADSAEWGGVMHQGGLIIARVTLKTGKNLRTVGLTTVAQAVARTGPTWTTKQDLCADCWDDLAIASDGESLKAAFVFPSWQNVKYSTAPFPGNFGGGLAMGVTGDRRTYVEGLIVDDEGTLVQAIKPRTITKTFPLYRPVDKANDLAGWPDRYTLAEIKTGPNRGYWYVTNHNYRTDWGYAVSAYFHPTSSSGANPSNYKSYKLTGLPGCTTYVADVSCYTALTIPCWSSAHGAQGYYQAASQAIDPQTGQNYNMAGVTAAIRAHERNRHWQAWLVNYVSQNKALYDVGTIMEAMTTRAATETAARVNIDTYMLQEVNYKYANDPLGGANEVINDPKPTFPLVDDAGATTLAPCSFF